MNGFFFVSFACYLDKCMMYWHYAAVTMVGTNFIKFVLYHTYTYFILHVNNGVSKEYLFI